MTSRSFHLICLSRRLLLLGKVITRDIMASIKMADGCRNVGIFRGIVCALVAKFRFFVSLWGTPMPRLPKARTGGGIRLRIGIGKMC
jgi:hypothetical protein